MSPSEINHEYQSLRYPYFTFVDGGDYRNDYQVLCHQATFELAIRTALQRLS
jgi:hypothetical protein